MARKKAPKNNLTIFGLQVCDNNGEAIGSHDASGQTYFRNMVIEFVARHFPDQLFEFFPNIIGPWQWGTCVDPQGFKDFLSENVAVELQEDGSVKIHVTSQVTEIVYHPNKDKRAKWPTKVKL